MSNVEPVEKVRWKKLQVKRPPYLPFKRRSQIEEPFWYPHFGQFSVVRDFFYRLVGCKDLTGGLAGMADMTPIAIFGHHSMTLEDVTDCRAAGQIPARVALMHDSKKLLGTPTGVSLSYFNEGRNDLLRGSVRCTRWPSRSFHQSLRPQSQIPVDPLIPSLA